MRILRPMRETWHLELNSNTGVCGSCRSIRCVRQKVIKAFIDHTIWKIKYLYIYILKNNKHNEMCLYGKKGRKRKTQSEAYNQKANVAQRHRAQSQLMRSLRCVTGSSRQDGDGGPDDTVRVAAASPLVSRQISAVVHHYVALVHLRHHSRPAAGHRRTDALTHGATSDGSGAASTTSLRLPSGHERVAADYSKLRSLSFEGTSYPLFRGQILS